MIIRVQAERNIAIDSPDHAVPWGTARDNSRNARFNHKLYTLFGRRNRQLRVLDLGCSGGGFVRDCLNDGCLAVGLEGSNYSKLFARGEWPALQDRFLFTADITANFRVTTTESAADEVIKFDVVTAWEVLEHLPEDGIPAFVENILRHLDVDGVAIFSISTNEDVVSGVRLHQTVRPRAWWVTTFARYGLHDHDSWRQYFNGQYIRGPKQGAPGSFHVHLARADAQLPTPPPRVKDRLADHWFGSRLHQRVRFMIGA